MQLQFYSPDNGMLYCSIRYTVIPVNFPQPAPSTSRKVGKYHQRGITYEATKGVHVESMTTVKFRGVKI